MLLQRTGTREVAVLQCCDQQALKTPKTLKTLNHDSEPPGTERQAVPFSGAMAPGSAGMAAPGTAAPGTPALGVAETS